MWLYRIDAVLMFHTALYILLEKHKQREAVNL